MSVAVVTGSSGLIGSETAKFLHEKGLHVVGIDNNMREYFFGRDGSTAWNTALLKRTLRNFTHVPADVREQEEIFNVFRQYGADISLVVHTAAQPSHDWAAREPFTDFTVNANGTLVLLEATRRHCPEAVFVFTSTNKVYGDTPNELPLVERETRWEVDPSHPYAEHGIDESMSIDQSKHSLFGASKVAADVLAQEYGRYFGMKTGTFRGGCLTGRRTRARSCTASSPTSSSAPSPARSTPSTATRGSRSETTSTPTTSSTPSGTTSRTRSRGPSTTWAARATATAPSLRPSASSRRCAGGGSTTSCPTRRAPATTSGGSATCAPSGRTTPAGRTCTTSAASSAKSSKQHRKGLIAKPA